MAKKPDRYQTTFPIDTHKNEGPEIAQLSGFMLQAWGFVGGCNSASLHTKVTMNTIIAGANSVEPIGTHSLSSFDCSALRGIS